MGSTPAQTFVGSGFRFVLATDPAIVADLVKEAGQKPIIDFSLSVTDKLRVKRKATNCTCCVVRKYPASIWPVIQFLYTPVLHRSE